MVGLIFAGPAHGQGRQVAATDVHKAPGGVVLARLPAPAPLDVGVTQGEWTQVTLEGWVYAPSLGTERRDGFDVVVTARDGENLRPEPNHGLVARLRYGMLLNGIETRGNWVHVRRSVWVPRRAVVATAAPPAARTARARDTSTAPGYRPMAEQKADTNPPARPVTAPAAGQGASERVELGRTATLLLTPEGGNLGTLEAGAPARVLVRSGDWVRVQTEGWVHEGDLRPAAGAALVGVSAAEVRANPDRYVGQVVEWRLQLVSIQTADELRPEMPPGQPYLLMRGPSPEPGFVYVMVPRDQLPYFRGLGPLEEITLDVKIRAARTRYLATPVVELVSMADPARVSH